MAISCHGEDGTESLMHLGLLRKGDSAWLESLPSSRYYELLALGPGAYYCSGRTLGKRAAAAAKDAVSAPEADRAAAGERAAALSKGATLLYSLSWDKEAEPWKREASLAWARSLRAAGDYALLLGRSRIHSAFYPADSEPWAWALESLHALGRPQELLLELADMRAAKATLRWQDAELVGFYEMSARIAVDRAAAAKLLPAFFLDKVWGAGQDGLYLEIEGAAGWEGIGGEGLRSDAAARHAVYARDYDAARAAFAAMMKARPPASLKPELARDAVKAFLYAPSGREEGIAIFSKGLAALKGRKDAAARLLSFYFNYGIGRLDRGLEHWKESLPYLRAAVALAPDGAQRDASIWYLIDGQVKVDPAKGLALVEEFAPSMASPDFFSDLLEPMGRDFLAAGKYAEYLRLERALRGRASAATQARMAYVAGRIAQEKLQAVPAAYVPGSPKGAKTATAAAAAKFYLERVFLFPGAHPYYPIMASIALGRDYAFHPGGDDAPEAGAAASSAESADPGLDGPFLESLAAFGLYEELRALLAARDPAMPPARARELAKSLAAEGKWAESILLAAGALSGSRAAPTRADLELIYPRPWLPDFSAAAARFNIDEALLYGLARTESYFMPGVVSSAGAVGLCQLMPDTAKGVAKTLGKAEYSLEDPGTNILFGAYFLRETMDRLSPRLYAVFAYNAGVARVRKWADKSTLPADLFLETVALDETRHYGRKVLAAAAAYGYLYYSLAPRELAARLLGR